MDTFVNSSWYYLRYTDPKNKKKIFEKSKADYWIPIDQYIGGPEHITGHLLYIRFYTKFLRDLGMIEIDEPVMKYFTQGIVLGKDGEKMSKSRGNMVEPLETIKKYGADSLRLCLVSISSADRNFSWDDKTIKGSFLFLKKVYEYFSNFKPGKTTPKLESKINKTIKEVTLNTEKFKHNLSIIRIRELFNSFLDSSISKKDSEIFLKLLHIYCPFITEEIWSNLGNKTFLSLEKWPIMDEKKINEKFEQEEKIVDKVIEDINNISRIIKEKGKEINKVYLYVLPNDKPVYLDNLKEIVKRTGIEPIIFSVNDKDKYDPETKSKKVKPGRPGIYIE